MIYLNNLCKSYGEQIILNNLNLKINEGDFISILGKSGSGKSTLLNIIGCLDNYDSGELKINGQSIYNNNNALKEKIRNNSIGFIFQLFYLIPDLNVEENIFLPFEYFRGDKKEMKKYLNAAEENIKNLGLDRIRKKNISVLSGGEKQRVAICRAIALQPKIIIADEPTGSLDIDNSINVVKLLKNMNKSDNKTVIIVTHNEKVANMTDIQYLLKDGRLQLVEK